MAGATQEQSAAHRYQLRFWADDWRRAISGTGQTEHRTPTHR